MAQPQKAPRPAKDPYAQRTKTLTSSVQRLRGWVGSDPSRQAELGDALLALTGHRLRGHEFAAAAADAQDSAKQAAQLLTARGAVGAYTEAADAARYVTAVVQLASVQAGLGLRESAGRTVASLDDLQEQFLALRLELPLPPEVVVRALFCAAQGQLAAGKVADANATADDVLAHLLAAGLRDEPDAVYLVLDVDRLLADARWAADRPEEALGHLHHARDRWADHVAGRLDAPAGLSPSLVERLAAPAFGLHRDLADRLMATGDLDLGLVTRRELVELLRRLTGRLGAPASRQLGAALADLAADLLAVDRPDEADAVSADALTVLGPQPDPGWPVVVRGQVLTRTGRPGQAVELLQSRPLPAEPRPATVLVHLALAEAHRALGDSEATAAAESAADQLSAALGLAGRDGLVERARGVVSRGRGPLAWAPNQTTVWDRLVPDAAAANAGSAARTAESAAVEDTAEWRAAERAEAHRHEEERSAQARADAEQRVLEQQEAERRAAEEQEQRRTRAAEQEQADRARREAAEEAERQDVKRRREERLETYRLEVERREAEARAEAEREAEVARERAPGAVDELAVATLAWQQARAGADRRATRAAAERLVMLLRPRAAEEPSVHGPLLQQALAELAGLRVRAGDLRGARSASREAKELGRSLGR